MGTNGTLTLDPAFTHSSRLALTLETPRGRRTQRFAKADQVAAELAYFARCIREDRAPEPSGHEGLLDVAIVNALLEAARSKRAVPLALTDKKRRPHAAEAQTRPLGAKPRGLVRVAAPRA